MKKRSRRRGSTLIIVLLICALLAGIGIPLLTLTNLSPKISGGMRFHEQAFNAAEAGGEAARLDIEGMMDGGFWEDFTGHYVTSPAGIDLPTDGVGTPNAAYFRRLTDAQILAAFDPDGDGEPNVSHILFFHQTFATDAEGELDPRFVFTAFLIDDEAGAATTNPLDAILVVIGCVRVGTRVVDSVRLEIELVLE